MRQVRFKFRCNIIISGKIIKEMPGSVASGTPCINWTLQIRLREREENIAIRFKNSSHLCNFYYKLLYYC